MIIPLIELEATPVTSAPGSKADQGDESLTADLLSLKLSSDDGKYAQTWSSVNEFPSDQEFKIGSYTLEAFYGNSEKEGFELPYYQGQQQFEVKANVATKVNLTATLANSMVSVSYTDAFRAFMSVYNSTIVSSKGNYHFIDASETRPVYVSPGVTSIEVAFIMPNGTSATIQVASFEAKPRHHYRFTIDVNNGNVSDATLVVKLDELLQQEDVLIDLSDDILNAPAPTVATQGFTAGETLSIIGYDASETPMSMNIVARGGIKNVMLQTQSTYLKSKGWPEAIDLAHADAATQSLLKGLGLNALGLFANPDKMAVIDFQGLGETIQAIAGDDNLSTFTVTVNDLLGKSSDPVSLSIKAIPVELTLSNPSPLYLYDGEATVVMNYNGIRPEQNIKFDIVNERGTFDNAPVKSMQQVTDGIYNVVVEVPSNESGINLRAVYRNSKTDISTVEIPREAPTFTVSTSENLTFAKYALIQVSAAPASVRSRAADGYTSEVSYDNGKTWTATTVADADGMLKIAVEPAKTPRIRVAQNGRYTYAISTTTESMLQLPNGNCDDATTTIPTLDNATGSNYSNVAFTSPWGTNNTMTSSQGSNNAYCRVSGTIGTTDSHSGNAVLIRTVGWGSGNTAVGTMSGTCKYLDAGLYHTGTTRSSRPEGYSSLAGSFETTDLNCGTAFTARPSALTFWYKYSAKNSADHGEALVEVLDASNTVISSRRVDLGATDTYRQITLPLTYTVNSPKAAKIYVRFLSTNVSTALTKDSKWLTAPAFGGNLGKAMWMGSQLYVDDIQLEY